MSFRYHGKQRTIAGGAFPAVGLAAACRWRDATREQLAAGIDPGVARKAAAQAARVAEANSFEQVARSWHGARDGHLSARYGDIIMKRMEAYLFPELGTKPIASIDAPTLLDAIRKIEDRGTLDVANRCRAYAVESSDGDQ